MIHYTFSAPAPPAAPAPAPTRSGARAPTAWGSGDVEEPDQDEDPDQEYRGSADIAPPGSAALGSSGPSGPQRRSGAERERSAGAGAGAGAGTGAGMATSRTLRTDGADRAIPTDRDRAGRRPLVREGTGNSFLSVVTASSSATATASPATASAASTSSPLASSTASANANASVTRADPSRTEGEDEQDTEGEGEGEAETGTETAPGPGPGPSLSRSGSLESFATPLERSLSEGFGGSRAQAQTQVVEGMAGLSLDEGGGSGEKGRAGKDGAHSSAAAQASSPTSTSTSGLFNLSRIFTRSTSVERERGRASARGGASAGADAGAGYFTPDPAGYYTGWHVPLGESTRRRGRERGERGREPVLRAGGASSGARDAKGKAKMQEEEWMGAEGREEEGEGEQGEMVDDEACFVDWDEPRVDFLGELPLELSLYVVLQLPSYRDVLRTSRVSRTWHSISMDNLVWRELFHRNPGWTLRPDVDLVLAKQARVRRSQAAALRSPGLPAAGLPADTNGAGASAGAMIGTEADGAQRRHSAIATGTVDAPPCTPTNRRSWRASLQLPSLPDLYALSLGVGSGSNSGSHASTAAPSSGLRASLASVASTASLSLSRRRGRSVNVDDMARDRLCSTASPAESSAAPATPLSTSAPSAQNTLFSSLTSGPSTPAGARRAHAWSISSQGTQASGSLGPELAPPQSAGESGDPFDWPRLYASRHMLERRWRGRRVTSPGRSKTALIGYQPELRYLHGHTDSVYCVRMDSGFGTGGRGKVVSGSRDRTIKVWDAENGKCTHTLKGHSGSVLCLRYDEEILVSGSSDTTLLIWDFRLEMFMDGPAQEAGSASASASASGSESADANTPRVLRKLQGHSSSILDLALDKTWIVSCGKDTDVRVWTRSSLSPSRVYTKHLGPVNAGAIQAGQAVTASGDGTIHLWSLESGETIRILSHDRGLACVAFDGSTIVSGSNDQTVRIWDMSPSGNGRNTLTLESHLKLVRAIDFEPDRKLIASGGYDQRVKLWDLETGDKLRDFKSHTARIFDVQFDTTRIVSASEDQRICIRDFGGNGLETALFG